MNKIIYDGEIVKDINKSVVKYNTINLKKLQENLGDSVKVMGIYWKKYMLKSHYMIRLRFNDIHPQDKQRLLWMEEWKKSPTLHIQVKYSKTQFPSLDWIKDNEKLIKDYWNKFGHIDKIVESYTNGQGFINCGYNLENDYEYKYYPINFDLRGRGFFYYFFTSGAKPKRVEW